MVRRTSFATHVPFFSQYIVHATSFTITRSSVVENWSRYVILNGLVAEGLGIIQTDVPAWFDVGVVGAHESC